MDAFTLAGKVGARSAGRNTWLAVCPAHDDRKPSLQIRDGTRAVLLKCWSNGCTPQQICKAWGISVRSLSKYADLPNSEQDHLARQRDARERRERAAWEADRKEGWVLWGLGEILNQREAAAAKHPDSPVIVAAYHRALEAHRAKELELYPDAQDGPLRHPGDLMLPPDWIAGVLRSIGKSFPKNERDDVSASSLPQRIKDVPNV